MIKYTPLPDSVRRAADKRYSQRPFKRNVATNHGLLPMTKEQHITFMSSRVSDYYIKRLWFWQYY